MKINTFTSMNGSIHMLPCRKIERGRGISDCRKGANNTGTCEEKNVCYMHKDGRREEVSVSERAQRVILGEIREKKNLDIPC